MRPQHRKWAGFDCHSSAIRSRSAPNRANPGQLQRGFFHRSVSARGRAGNFSPLRASAAAASSVGAGGAALCAACPAREAAQTVVRAHDRHTVRVPKAGSKLGTVGGHRGAAAARAAGVRRSSGGAAGARRRTCSLDLVYTPSGRRTGADGRRRERGGLDQRGRSLGNAAQLVCRITVSSSTRGGACAQ